ncbi:serine/threonine protein kinase [bacterium]|nr:serine/threonine protein kinase [bacterium]
MQGMSEDQFLHLQPGTVVNGRYEIVKCLGTGSMGLVYACRHRELAGHLVAMKVLFSEVARDQVAVQRFRNEIVASYGVSHPNVVRAYEYFRDGDLVAFTMEYVGGGDLADRIVQDELLTVPEIVRMLSQMCSGVQAIHEAGIIHRDLKPENILLTAQGDIKITDFGIARTGSGPKLTEHGGVVGTIDYVSPEYLEKGQVDARSDIYALGVLGFEMITGEAPFKGKSVIETMTLRLKSDPPFPSEIRNDCPPELDQIIMRAMKRDPEERYQTAKQIYRDLQDLMGGGTRTYSRDRLEKQVKQVKQSSDASVQAKPSGYTANGSNAGNQSIPTEFSQIAVKDIPGSKDSKRGTSGSRKKFDPDDVEELESVLGNQSVVAGPRGFSERVPRVAVGHSHLSADRIRALSDGIYTEETSMFKTLLVWTMVLILGFVVTLVVLREIRPDLFGAAKSKVGIVVK